jgi:hypothetical protein
LIAELQVAPLRLCRQGHPLRGGIAREPVKAADSDPHIAHRRLYQRYRPIAEIQSLRTMLIEIAGVVVSGG